MSHLSSATRVATPMAANRRGCVHTILHRDAPLDAASSRMNWERTRDKKS
jgi:hypothetical protein